MKKKNDIYIIGIKHYDGSEEYPVKYIYDKKGNYVEFPTCFYSKKEVTDYINKINKIYSGPELIPVVDIVYTDFFNA